MRALFHFMAPLRPCGYLPEQLCRMEYVQVSQLSPAEYAEKLFQGWRHFGCVLFRPRCPACNACRSLRVAVEHFHPNRSQWRARKANEGTIHLEIGTPAVTRAKLHLYDRYHAYQSEAKGWPEHPAEDTAEFAQSFVHNPFPVQEWCYYLGTELVGVGYVDELPGALSAIYFFYDPNHHERSLGTWNVLSMIERAAAKGIPHVYLGYYVAGCPSMVYKAKFVPNQILEPDGEWHDFRR